MTDLYAMRDELAREREMMRARVHGEIDPEVKRALMLMAAHRRIERDVIHTILRAREIEQHADQDSAHVLHLPARLRVATPGTDA